jgi:hypothetical protein
MGGSVEHYNKEAGYVWGQRLVDTYRHAVWFNPVPQQMWPFTQSIGMVSKIMRGRMFPLTIEGLDQGIRLLSK